MRPTEVIMPLVPAANKTCSETKWIKLDNVHYLSSAKHAFQYVEMLWCLKVSPCCTVHYSALSALVLLYPKPKQV